VGDVQHLCLFQWDSLAVRYTLKHQTPANMKTKMSGGGEAPVAFEARVEKGSPSTGQKRTSCAEDEAPSKLAENNGPLLPESGEVVVLAQLNIDRHYNHSESILPRTFAAALWPL